MPPPFMLLLLLLLLQLLLLPLLLFRLLFELSELPLPSPSPSPSPSTSPPPPPLLLLLLLPLEPLAPPPLLPTPPPPVAPVTFCSTALLSRTTCVAAVRGPSSEVSDSDADRSLVGEPDGRRETAPVPDSSSRVEFGLNGDRGRSSKEGEPRKQKGSYPPSNDGEAPKSKHGHSSRTNFVHNVENQARRDPISTYRKEECPRAPSSSRCRLCLPFLPSARDERRPSKRLFAGGTWRAPGTKDTGLAKERRKKPGGEPVAAFFNA